jgi:hypothetical protein
VTLLAGLSVPHARGYGAVEVGFELGGIPSLNERQRTVGFDGTKVEDLNRTPVFGRLRLLVGLPAGFSAEVGWVPPIEIDGSTSNLLDLPRAADFRDPDARPPSLRPDRPLEGDSSRRMLPSRLAPTPTLTNATRHRMTSQR